MSRLQMLIVLLGLLLFVGCQSAPVQCDPVCQPPQVQFDISRPSYYARTMDMRYQGLFPVIPDPKLLPVLPPVDLQPQRLPPVEFPVIPQNRIQPYDEVWGGMIVFSFKE